MFLIMEYNGEGEMFWANITIDDSCGVKTSDSYQEAIDWANDNCTFKYKIVKID